MSVGARPIQAFALGVYGNATIAASAQGTAAATIITSAASAYAFRAIEVWNLTGQNLDLVLGPDNTTATYTSITPGTTPVMQIGNGTIFCPGNATISIATVRGERVPIAFAQNMAISVRTCGTIAVTCASTNPLVINLWE